jgi:hypothetical protein
MPVYFDQDGTFGVATWQKSADAPGRVCCSVDLSAYHNSARARELFAELTAVVADLHRRQFALDDAALLAERLDAFPYCRECTSEQAAEIRSLIGQGATVDLTPNGTPILCCRVRAVGAFNKSDTPQPTARGWR